jgi:hypothetical protein
MQKSTIFPFSVSTYSSGQQVPRSGTFRFNHKHAKLHEIALLKDHIFPSCSHCGLAVHYAFVNWLPYESASSRFRLLMHKAQPLSSGS